MDDDELRRLAALGEGTTGTAVSCITLSIGEVAELAAEVLRLREALDNEKQLAGAAMSILAEKIAAARREALEEAELQAALQRKINDEVF